MNWTSSTTLPLSDCQTLHPSIRSTPHARRHCCTEHCSHHTLSHPILSCPIIPNSTDRRPTALPGARYLRPGRLTGPLGSCPLIPTGSNALLLSLPMASGGVTASSSLALSLNLLISFPPQHDATMPRPPSSTAIPAQSSMARPQPMRGTLGHDWGRSTSNEAWTLEGLPWTLRVIRCDMD